MRAKSAIRTVDYSVECPLSALHHTWTLRNGYMSFSIEELLHAELIWG